MHKRFQRAYTSIKENTFVGCAKIATVGGFCDIDLIIVKATSPDDIPLRDRYVLQLLKIFSVSPPSYRTFATSFSRRFSKTKCWRVALKCLILLHRLLRALPYNSPFRTELLWTRSNGYLSLDPCPFRDTSSSNSHDYTHFISSYANLLNEALDCLTVDCVDAYIDPEESTDDENDEEHETLIPTYPDKMKLVSEKLEILPQLQTLIDRVIDCKPKGAAARSFLIQCALKYIIRDSFFCYNNYRCEIVSVLDHLIQLPYRSCMTAFGVYKKAAVQADHLSEFYDWCKSVGLCGSYEYPFVDRIPEIQIQALESFLDGMWQLTESSSSSPMASTVESSSSSLEDEKPLIRFNNWVQFDDEEKNEEHALITFATNDNNNVMTWEVLLEASADSDGGSSSDLNEENGDDLRIQVYNPYVVNPFH
ncbi:putative ANTH domain, phosphoinositide-binding clathrin adaptor, domain 2 [Helianthus annuus]|uniref:ANTH domain, phosphoinositide-binding clathrin adaptor, domain 2 n=1 Tax=Helianthus annuus TaxID=4232 RepID=A0A251U5F6_HELAN|nr:putative ANTH domain, phosphoinositide-binding clathrin adaptor, domain 2 [Helianthus annuus]KAJ0546835.1 putative ANTH domain, ENTH domain, phosphoinositide-binding clathrin adaptor, domain 2 [Helianthus annuus]KAJ0719125.1 putative ANTH domain, ENTH domain, ANTH domain superfamily protein [Helianthus annuus]KAJ0722379.1 putative ANTH domain, ENTH domain, ANTH domain superfamily protein [Helianthus annuus]